jgi:hypothetical protein
MDEAGPTMIPQVSGQYLAVIKAIADLPVEAKATVADGIRAERTARRAKAESVPTGAGESKQRRKRGS